MLIVSRDDPQYRIAADVPPAARVASGTVLVVETHDARAGRLRRPEDVKAVQVDYSQPFPKSCPVTGPVYVEAAMSGDAIAVDILAIDLDPQGYMVAKPARGIVQGLVKEDTAKILHIEDGHIRFDDLRIPVRPMVGTIATAPELGEFAPVKNGNYGGNLDCRRIEPGSRVYMPVRHPGGLLFLGDVHARMGDGEACGNGVEIGARVTLRVSVVPGGARPWPWIETDDLLIALATAPTYEAAAELAVLQMMALLGERYGCSSLDAYLLVSAAGDIGVNQTCRYPIDVSVRVEFPKLAVP